MSVEHTYHCDGPDCVRYVESRHRRPPVFLTVDEPDGHVHGRELHFCGWDCILRYAGHREPEQIIEADE